MQNVRTSPPLSGISNLMKMQGRYGDSELVHMSPMEVKGLSSLGKLTRNPDTGLPEAFSIGGFFRDYVAPVAIAAIPVIGPQLAVGYSMAKTGAMGGDLGDVALAGLTTYAGGKIGQKLGGVLDGLGSSAATAAGGTANELAKVAAETGKVTIGQRAGEAFSGIAAPAVQGSNPFTGEILGLSADQLVSKIPETVAPQTLGSKVGDALSSMIPKTAAEAGAGLGRGLGSSISDSMLQQKLQSQTIPKQVKDAEEIETGFNKTQLNRNAKYSRDANPLTTSQITAAATGSGAPIQYYNPNYISSMGLNEGGGIQDALEAITEKAEELADVSDGEVYFEGMVKGKGDGMSDEIPFSIEGEQPALLSRDEYVLPADVVSALGNGSSNAGADTLDKFMTAVRKKSMGRERQINEIG
tara:strand:- start:2214 stop:3449 length:1236 start_codon:yes stop_codon:yes gene_type:complete